MSEKTLQSGVEFDARHLGGAVIGAVVVALYAAWMAADVAGRWLVFPLVGVVAGYFLLQRTDAGDKIVFVGYAIAALLLITPLFFIFPEIFSGFETGLMARAFGLANLLIVVVFVIPAVIVAYATYRFSGGQGLIQRIRS